MSVAATAAVIFPLKNRIKIFINERIVRLYETTCGYWLGGLWVCVWRRFYHHSSNSNNSPTLPGQFYQNPIENPRSISECAQKERRDKKKKRKEKINTERKGEREWEMKRNT